MIRCSSRLVLLAAVLSAALSLSANSAQEPEEAPEEGLVFSPEVEAILNEAPEQAEYGEMERCIQVRSIRSSDVLDDRHVVFELSSNRYYLVQFQHQCHQLRRNVTIAYEPRGSQLCRLDSLHAVNGMRPGTLGPPCSIPGFHPVTAEQVALLKEALKAERKAEMDAYKAEKARRKAEQEASDSEG